MSRPRRFSGVRPAGTRDRARSRFVFYRVLRRRRDPSRCAFAGSGVRRDQRLEPRSFLPRACGGPHTRPRSPRRGLDRRVPIPCLPLSTHSAPPRSSVPRRPRRPSAPPGAQGRGTIPEAARPRPVRHRPGRQDSRLSDPPVAVIRTTYRPTHRDVRLSSVWRSPGTRDRASSRSQCPVRRNRRRWA